MEHLSAETLARLVDESPTDEERRHLESCDRCRSEADALRQQTEALGRLPDLLPAPRDWPVLEARLMSEGLLDPGGRFRSGLARTPSWLRTVAMVILFLAGTGVGAVAVNGPGVGSSTSALSALSVGPFGAASDRTPTVDEAAEAVHLAERQYVDALVRYRQLVDSRDGDGVPDTESRIAALEHLVRAGQAALREAPADPFLNGLVASAVAEREAVLQRVSSSGNDTWY